MEVLRVEEKKSQEREREKESESQEDQDMTKLLNFTKTQEKRR